MDPDYDDWLAEKKLKGVFFCLSRYNGGRPTRTTYPYNFGVKEGNRVDRLWIPTSTLFEAGRELVKVKDTQTETMNQRLYAALTQYEQDWCTIMGWLTLPLEKLTVAQDGAVVVPAYGSRIWVNVFVPGDIELSEECEWDTVKFHNPSDNASHVCVTINYGTKSIEAVCWVQDKLQEILGRETGLKSGIDKCTVMFKDNEISLSPDQTLQHHRIYNGCVITVVPPEVEDDELVKQFNQQL